MSGILLAGCTAGGSGESAQSSGGGPGLAEPAAPDQPPADAAGGVGPQGKDQAAEAPNLSVDQRSIVYTGSITVRVENVNTAAARAIGFATAAGGFVGQDNRTSGDGAGQVSLTLRVPAEKFSSVVDQLAGLGAEETRGISTEDVTEETIDLDARIAVQQARVDSGRRLLAQAKSLADLVMLEKEVATRESDLASLQAKKRRLADLTALSTITAVLLDPEADAATDDGPPGFLAGLQGGWGALLASLAVLVTVLGAVLPWLVALGLPLWAILYAYRRWRRTHPAPTRPARGPFPPVTPAFAPAGRPTPGYPQPPLAAGDEHDRAADRPDPGRSDPEPPGPRSGPG
ncbi:MAG TPA: DUF4349 domain-containing protein [Actinoplanes sp.]|nr:DUF4349 domain-containing protein [Actinoplanes sp.]